MKSLIECLKEVPDPRKPQGRRHELWQILLVIILGIMSGYRGYQQLGRFAERHRRNLIAQLSILRHTVPSYSTMRRVMIAIDYEKLNSVFNGWALTQNLITGAAIAGDGKSLRNTVSNCMTSQQNFVSVVSLFAHQSGIVVGTAIMKNKASSEIEVVQQLLGQLALEHCVYTLDALHCQKKTVETIVAGGNDYLIKVKANQPKLQKAISLQSEQSVPVQVSDTEELTRGRKSQRRVEVFTKPENLDPAWKNVESVIRVTRSGERDGAPYKTLSYYISSLPATAKRISSVIREHWHIENRLHWVKDVIFHEDESTQKAGKAPINFSIIHTWILSIFRMHGFDSIKAAIERFSHDLPAMSALLT